MKLLQDVAEQEVKKIITDPVSNKVYLFVPIFPLGVKSNPTDPRESYAMDTDFPHIYKELQRAVGKADLTLVKGVDNHFIHPRDNKNNPQQNYILQQSYSLGKLAYVAPKPINNKVIGAYEITDPTGQKVLMKYEESVNKGLIPFHSSSQIAREPSDDQFRVRNFDLMHTTLTDNPAFGKAHTKIGAVCRGDIYSCAYQYGAASNETGEIGINIHGDVIDFRHDKCPFCVETELTGIFEDYLKSNNDYILNSSSDINMSATDPKNSEILQPDKNETKGAPFNAEELASLVTKKLEEQRKANEISKPTEPTPTEAPKEEKKNDNVQLADLENHPAFKKVMSIIEAQANELKTLRGEKAVTDTQLESYKKKTNEDEIGMTLAEFEHNFHDPDTGKPDPKAFEEAYKYAVGEGMEPAKVKVLLQKLSPFGTKPRKSVTAQVTHKASRNHGVPKYNSAFGASTEEEDQEVESEEEDGTQQKIQHSAGPKGFKSRGPGVIEYFVNMSNNLD